MEMMHRVDSQQTVQSFLLNCKQIVDDCVRLATNDGMRPDTVSACIRRLDSVWCAVQRATSVISGDTSQLMQLICQLKEVFCNCIDNASGSVQNTAYTASSIPSQSGSSSFDIPQGQLQFLLSCGFSVEQMSVILHVSTKTVQRRLRSFGLQSPNVFTELSDSNLDDVVRRHSQTNDKLGANSVQAMLFSEGIKVQRQRVRHSMQRVNPVGVFKRTVLKMHRRKYSVAGPNSLWHIDGNHKLIRWRIVIHGGIDGFSRLVVFMGASDNNRQDTVLKHFINACVTYSLPSRIRVDDGGENNAICNLMHLVRGREHNPAIRGSSVHNQRIERLWRDLWNWTTNTFYKLFYFMEDNHILDCNNERHLWAVHYVFLPRINAALLKFQQQWNSHGLRTEHGLTPNQLFVSRALDRFHSPLTSMRNMFHPIQSRSSYTTPSPTTHNAQSATGTSNAHQQPFVSVPALPCPLSEAQLQQLHRFVHPLDDSLDPLGVSLYLTTVAFIDANT